MCSFLNDSTLGMLNGKKTNFCGGCSVTYKRYKGSICDEQSGLNVRPECSLPSLLAHFQPAGIHTMSVSH